MKKLYCHTALKDAVLEGASYEIVGGTLDGYEIIDEQGYEHEFTKEPDEDGLSYKTWFNLVLPKKSKPIEGFFDGLGEIVNIKEKEHPTYSDEAFTFKLSDAQTKKAKEWMKEREEYVGAIGGQFSFIFKPTGLGDIVTLTDGEEELKLTDYDLW